MQWTKRIVPRSGSSLHGNLSRSLFNQSSASTLTRRVFGNPNTVQLLSSVYDRRTQEFPDFGVETPEVIVTGRANVGKSSLVNAILGRTDIARTSSKAGHTQSLNFYGVGAHVDKPARLVLVDAPGYGNRGRPEWGSLFMDYVQNRSTLRRVYVLINAAHPISQYDKDMLRMLDEACLSPEAQRRHFPLTFEAVLTKCDTISSPTSVGRINQEIWDVAPTCLPIKTLTSTRKSYRTGIEELRASIVESCAMT